MGLVQRGRGRVELLVTSSRERHHLLRAGERVEEKKRIAALAADFLSDGMALFLDASTTVRQICPLLRPFQHLTVVTNGLETAQAVTPDAAYRLIFHRRLLAGRYRAPLSGNRRSILCAACGWISACFPAAAWMRTACMKPAFSRPMSSRP